MPCRLRCRPRSREAAGNPGAHPAVAPAMSAFSLLPRIVRARTAALGAGMALALASTLALAMPDDVAQHEIEHLLDFVAASKCTFVRSGERFAPEAARNHLAMKYRFTKFRLSTADEFVQYLATASSTTGEPYTVICNQKERPAGAWLAEELRHFRKIAQTAPR
jgi:hypothetical protein